jgi:hypothetical protein
MEERWKDGERGIESTGVGFFAGARRVPVPEMMGDQILAVAEADKRIVGGELQIKDGPEDPREQRENEDLRALCTEPMREGRIPIKK